MKAASGIAQGNLVLSVNVFEETEFSISPHVQVTAK
jgi:hypothetical protein